MNINDLIKKLNNLKSKGVEEIQVIDDDLNDLDMEVEDHNSIGFLIVYPSQEEVKINLDLSNSNVYTPICNENSTQDQISIRSSENHS